MIRPTLSSSKSRKKVTSLTKLCILKLLSNQNLLKDVPSLSLYYHLIKPVFEKMTKQQLYLLELKDPNLIGLTEELWFQLLNKKFPDHKSHKKEKRFTNSRDLYLYLESVQDMKRQRLIEKLRSHTKELELLKNSKQIEIISHVPQRTRSINYANGPMTSLSRLNFKSSILQKINKECSSKEKKFNHDMKFNELQKRKLESTSPSASNPLRPLKRPHQLIQSSTMVSDPNQPHPVRKPQQSLHSPSQKISSTSTPSLRQQPSSSLFIPRSRPTLKPIIRSTPTRTTPPKKSRTPIRNIPKPPRPPPPQSNKKSSIFVKLSSIKGQ